jgi:hypothetical protein
VSEQGVPIEEATAKDFMMVRAALVTRLGGADAALVWARIHYRSDSDSRVAEEHDGRMWWRASHGALAAETGLTEKQARSAIETLVDGGYVERTNRGGRAYLYRAVTYLPNRADTQSAPEGRSIRPDGQMHLPDPADRPLIETLRQEDTPVVPTGDAIEKAFDRIWSTWHPQRRGTTKLVRAKLDAAVKTVGGVSQLGVILDAVDRDVAVWRTWPAGDAQFIPLLPTWLNQGRWEPQAAAQPRGGRMSTVDAGRAADAILAQQEQLAVSA